MRIELRATRDRIRQALTAPEALRHWWFSGWPPEDHAPLTPGKTVELWWGVLPIQVQVREVRPDYLQWQFSRGVDGFQTWYWGEGWVQVRLEAVTFLPVGVGQAWQLWRLRDYLEHSMPHP